MEFFILSLFYQRPFLFKQVAQQDVSDVFLQFGVDPAKEDSILIKQNTTTIVTSSSRDLLRTMEDSAGTTALGEMSLTLSKEVLALGNNISTIKQRITDIENRRTQIQSCCLKMLIDYEYLIMKIHYHGTTIMKRCYRN